MKTPDFFIPFDPNKIDRSPIMTPEINAIAVRLHQSEKKKSFLGIKNSNEANHEMASSIYGDEKEEKKYQNNYGTPSVCNNSVFFFLFLLFFF